MIVNNTGTNYSKKLIDVLRFCDFTLTATSSDKSVQCSHFMFYICFLEICLFVFCRNSFVAKVH